MRARGERLREHPNPGSSGREAAPAMRARRFTVVLLVLSTSSFAPLAAQVPAGGRRPAVSSPWLALLTDAAQLVVTPTFDAFEVGSSRAGVDAGIQWEHRTSSDRIVRLGLDFGAAWRAASTYRRTGVAAAYGLEGDRAGATLQLSAAVGSGAGARTVFSAEASGRAGALRMNVRTNLLHDHARPDSMALPGGRFAPSFVTESSRYTDAELSAHRLLGKLQASATIGARFGQDHAEKDQWAFAQVVAPLHSRLGLELAAGWQPERRDLAQPPGAFGRVALRLAVPSGNAPAPAPGTKRTATLAILPLPSGGYRLSVDCAPATRAELKGDLTDWEPVVLRSDRSAPERCSVVLHAEPGVYHIVMSIGGGPWTVPPGLTPVPDGFGGLAGLLSLPSPVNVERGGHQP